LLVARSSRVTRNVRKEIGETKRKRKRKRKRKTPSLRDYRRVGKPDPSLNPSATERFPMFEIAVFFSVWSVSVLAVGVAYHRYNANTSAE
jgi:hypothetical protein